MRTTHLLLAGALLFTQPAIAQATRTGILQPLKPAAHSASTTAAKTTATASRLIAETGLGNDGTNYIIEDSTAVYYSGTRGGDLTTGYIKYDSGYEYAYNAGTSSYTNAEFATQTFDANNNTLTSELQLWIASSSSWRNYVRYSYTYDGSNNILTYSYQSWDTVASVWVNVSNDIYTYDGSNNELTYIYQQWTAGAWVNSSKETYTYDGSNNMLTRLQQTWDAGTSAWDNEYYDIYTYTTANKEATDITQQWTAGAWVNQNKYAYTYDASNNPTVALDQYWDGGSSAWINDYQNVYTYDASNDMLTDLYQNWDAGTSAWINEDLTTYSSFTDLQPGLSIYQSWNATTLLFDNSSKTTYTYNSHGQETSYYTSTWNIGGFWQPTISDGGQRYYYQDYTTSVTNISNNNCSSSVYPVPAKDMLHVSITWNEPQAFTIQIMDMSGRTISQWQMPEAKSYDGNITISSLAPGNYILRMTGTNAQSVKQIIVAK